jgi:hypothetical protein
MNMPFTTEQFFSVFENYNSAVFPLQVLILIIAIIAVYSTLYEKSYRNRLIGGLLAFIWIWIGVAYHIFFFASINPAAYVFGGLFIIQGIFFYIETFVRKNLVFKYNGSVKGSLSLFFILFGLVIYPVISYYLEGSMLKTISFGLPCPTTIVTFGFLMLTDKKLPGYLLIIPTLWALIGTAAAVNFGVYQDYIMIVAAIIANIYLIRKRK